MDNFSIDITSDKDLDHAMVIAFHNAPGGKASHWFVDDVAGIAPNAKRLIFLWHYDERLKPQPLLTPIDADGAVVLARAWLEQQDYGTQPDHDGDNGKGWRLYNESWGHVADSPYAFVAIEPAWAMYGK